MKEQPRKALVMQRAWEIWKTWIERVGAKPMAVEMDMSLSHVYSYGREPERREEYRYSPLERAVTEGAKLAQSFARMGRPELAQEVGDYVRLAIIKQAFPAVEKDEPPALQRSRDALMAACGQLIAALARGEATSEAFYAEQVALAAERHLERVTGYRVSAPAPLRAVS